MNENYIYPYIGKNQGWHKMGLRTAFLNISSKHMDNFFEVLQKVRHRIENNGCNILHFGKPHFWLKCPNTVIRTQIPKNLENLCDFHLSQFPKKYASNEPSTNLLGYFFTKIWLKLSNCVPMPKYGDSDSDPLKFKKIFFKHFSGNKSV